MATRKQQADKLAFANFVGAMTARDEVPPFERLDLGRLKKQDDRSARTRLDQLAELAFYEASIAALHVRMGWDHERGDPALRPSYVQAERTHTARIVLLIDALDRVMALPPRAKADAKEKAAVIKRYGSACSGNASAVSTWRAAVKGWRAGILAEGQSLGLSLSVEG